MTAQDVKTAILNDNKYQTKECESGANCSAAEKAKGMLNVTDLNFGNRFQPSTAALKIDAETTVPCFIQYGGIIGHSNTGYAGCAAVVKEYND